MKRRLVLFAVFLALGIYLAACSQKACPAYTQENTEKSDEAG